MSFILTIWNINIEKPNADICGDYSFILTIWNINVQRRFINRDTKCFILTIWNINVEFGKYYELMQNVLY